MTDRGLIVASQEDFPQTPTSPSYLYLIDPVTGRVAATTRLGATTFDDAVQAWGELWVTVSDPEGKMLLRLDPATLKETRRWALGGGPSGLGYLDLAVAGGAFWVADKNRLLRISPTSGAVTLTIPLPGATSSDVASNAAGTVLIDGEANDGHGALQRRDPITGAVLASRPYLGVAAPLVSGVAGNRVWVAEPTGMMGYVELLNLTTLGSVSPRPCSDGEVGPTCAFGTNAIRAILSDGLVWVTQVAGPGRNYCANPFTGQKLGTLDLPNPRQDQVVAVGSQEIYYQVTDVDSYLAEVPLPPHCPR